MKTPQLLLAAAAMWFTGCAAQSGPRLGPEPEWTASGDFSSPESAVHDAARDQIIVSNVSGYTRNGKGYLSRLALDGTVLEAKWVSGINAPTGMAIKGDTLYVADFDRLRIIDLPSGKISMTIRLPEENPGLNDVTLSPDGEVFVTASNINTLYQLVEVFAKQGPPLALRPWLVSDKLSYANGIWADEENVWVAAWHLYRIDRATLEMHGPIGVDQGLEDLESIESDGTGGFFITLIGPRPIMYLKQGSVSELLPREIFSADVEYIESTQQLVVPSGGDTVSLFKLNQ